MSVIDDVMAWQKARLDLLAVCLQVARLGPRGQMVAVMLHAIWLSCDDGPGIDETWEHFWMGLARQTEAEREQMQRDDLTCPPYPWWAVKH